MASNAASIADYCLTQGFDLRGFTISHLCVTFGSTWPIHAGTLVYELITGKQLFEVGNNLASYEAKLASFHLMDFSNCPQQLVPTLKAMLSRQPSARPNANAFAGAPYFQVTTLAASWHQRGLLMHSVDFAEAHLQSPATYKVFHRVCAPCCSGSTPAIRIYDCNPSQRSIFLGCHSMRQIGVCALLQEDVVVRALRFLEGFLQRDALQKAAFLKDLEGLWSRCDTRVLRYRVLPPLLAESRNEALQPVILPLIMRIVQRQESQVKTHPCNLIPSGVGVPV